MKWPLRLALAAFVLGLPVARASAQGPGAVQPEPRPAFEPAAQPAAPLVVLIVPQGEPARDGLLSALRIQLGTSARVESRTPALPTGSPIEQAARTTLASEHARLALWVEQTPVAAAHEQGEPTLHVLRARADGSIASAMSSAAGLSGPDLDRTLALKVSELLAEPDPSAQAAPPVSAPTPPPAPPPAIGRESPAAWRWGAVAQLGAVAGLAVGRSFGTFGPLLAAGATVARERLRLGALLDLTWLPLVHHDDAGTEIEVQEWIPALSLHAQLALPPLWLGVHSGLALSFVHAEAWTARDHGEASERSASWYAGVGVELPITSALGLALELDARTQLRRQRFSVVGDEIADSGRVRPYARIAVTYRPGP